MSYIATFFSHFGAIRFKKECDAKGWDSKMMPVPRELSSSCGTCVKWVGKLPEAFGEDIEQVVECEDGGYKSLYNVMEE